MIADLYIKYHCSGNDQILTLLEAFVAHYPVASQDSVYRIVGQVGENFFHWRIYVPENHTQTHVDEVLNLGVELIIMGMEKDRQRIGKTFLNCLFI